MFNTAPNPPPSPKGQPSVYRMGEMYHYSNVLKERYTRTSAVDYTPSTIIDHSISDTYSSIKTKKELEIEQIEKVNNKIDNLIPGVLDKEKKASLCNSMEEIEEYYNKALNSFFELIEDYSKKSIKMKVFKVILWTEWNKLKSFSKFTLNKKKGQCGKKQIESIIDISNFEYMTISNIYDLAKIEEKSTHSSHVSLYYYYISQSFKASQMSEYYAGISFLKNNKKYKCRDRLKNAKGMASKAKEFNNEAIKKILNEHGKKHMAKKAAKRGSDIKTLVEKKTTSSNDIILPQKTVKDRWEDEPLDYLISYLVEKENLNDNIETIKKKLSST